MNLANEGREAKQKEDETAKKKRKAEDDARWEGEFALDSTLLFTSLTKRLAITQRTVKLELIAGETLHQLALAERKRRRKSRSWDNLQYSVVYTPS